MSGRGTPSSAASRIGSVDTTTESSRVSELVDLRHQFSAELQGLRGEVLSGGRSVEAVDSRIPKRIEAKDLFYQVKDLGGGRYRIKVNLPIFTRNNKGDLVEVGVIKRHPVEITYDPSRSEYTVEHPHENHRKKFRFVVPASDINARLLENDIAIPESTSFESSSVDPILEPPSTTTSETLESTSELPFDVVLDGLPIEKQNAIIRALKISETFLASFDVTRVSLPPSTRRVTPYADIQISFRDKSPQTIGLMSVRIGDEAQGLADQIVAALDSPESFEFHYEREKESLIADLVARVGDIRVGDEVLNPDTVNVQIVRNYFESFDGADETFSQFRTWVTDRFDNARIEIVRLLHSDGDQTWEEILRSLPAEPQGLGFYDEAELSRLRTYYLEHEVPKLEQARTEWEEVSNIHDNLEVAFNTDSIQHLLWQKGIKGVGHLEDYATVRSLRTSVPVNLPDYVAAWDGWHRYPIRSSFGAVMEDNSIREFSILLAEGPYREGAVLDSPAKLARRIQEALASFPDVIETDIEEEEDPFGGDDMDLNDGETESLAQLREEREQKKQALTTSLETLFPNRNFSFGKPFRIRNVTFVLPELPPTDINGPDDFWDVEEGKHSLTQGIHFFSTPNQTLGPILGVTAHGQIVSGINGVLVGSPDNPSATRSALEDAIARGLGSRQFEPELIVPDLMTNPGNAYFAANPDYDFGVSFSGEMVDISDLFQTGPFAGASYERVNRQVRHPMTPAIMQRLEAYSQTVDKALRHRSVVLTEYPDMQRMYEPIPPEDLPVLREIVYRTMGVTIPDDIAGKSFFEVNRFLKFATGDPHASIQPSRVQDAVGGLEPSKTRGSLERTPQVEDGNFVVLDINSFHLENSEDLFIDGGSHHGLDLRWWEQYQGQGKTLVIDLRDNGGGHSLAENNYLDAVLEGGSLDNNLFGEYRLAVDHPDMVEMAEVFPEIVIITTNQSASAAEGMLHGLMKHHPNVRIYGENPQTRGKYTSFSPISLQDRYSIFYTTDIWQLDFEAVGEDVDYHIPRNENESEADYLTRVKGIIRAGGEEQRQYETGVPPSYYRAFEHRFDASINFDWVKDNCPNLFQESAGNIVLSDHFKTLLDSTNLFWRDLDSRSFYQLDQQDLQLLNMTIGQLGPTETLMDPITKTYIGEESRPTPNTYQDMDGVVVIGYACALSGSRAEFYNITDYLDHLQSLPRFSIAPSLPQT